MSIENCLKQNNLDAYFKSLTVTDMVVSDLNVTDLSATNLSATNLSATNANFLLTNLSFPEVVIATTPNYVSGLNTFPLSQIQIKAYKIGKLVTLEIPRIEYTCGPGAQPGFIEIDISALGALKPPTIFNVCVIIQNDDNLASGQLYSLGANHLYVGAAINVDAVAKFTGSDTKVQSLNTNTYVSYIL